MNESMANTTSTSIGESASPRISHSPLDDNAEIMRLKEKVHELEKIIAKKNEIIEIQIQEAINADRERGQENKTLKRSNDQLYTENNDLKKELARLKSQFDNSDSNCESSLESMQEKRFKYNSDSPEVNPADAKLEDYKQSIVDELNQFFPQYQYSKPDINTEFIKIGKRSLKLLKEYLVDKNFIKLLIESDLSSSLNTVDLVDNMFILAQKMTDVIEISNFWDNELIKCIKCNDMATVSSTNCLSYHGKQLCDEHGLSTLDFNCGTCSRVFVGVKDNDKRLPSILHYKHIQDCMEGIGFYEDEFLRKVTNSPFVPVKLPCKQKDNPVLERLRLVHIQFWRVMKHTPNTRVRTFANFCKGNLFYCVTCQSNPAFFVEKQTHKKLCRYGQCIEDMNRVVPLYNAAPFKNTRSIYDRNRQLAL